MTIRHETELYEPIKNYLENLGYKVNGEVGNCDVFAVLGGKVIVVELKRGLTIELLTQAVNRQKISDSVYMAVPKPKRFKVTPKWKDTIHLIRRLELGLLFVNSRNGVEVIVEPDTFDRNRSAAQHKKRREKLVSEANKRTIDGNYGGSTRKKLLTSYREEALYIAFVMGKTGEAKPKRLRELGCDKEKTLGILYTDHYGWFENIKNGHYNLTAKGKNAVEEYKALHSYFDERFNKAVSEKE